MSAYPGDIGKIGLIEYVDILKRSPGLIYQSIEWRLDHILDDNISQDTRQQWIDEIKEVLQKIRKDFLQTK